MAIIIDFKSHKILARNPEPTYAPDSDSNDWYAEIITRTEARFGDKLPSHFGETMDYSREFGSLTPYMHGDCFNLQYPWLKRQRKGKLYNAPYPVPCKVKQSVARIVPSALHGDPLPWMDMKYRCMYNHIKARNGLTLHISTRSDLIAHDDYIAVLDKRYHTIEIILSNKTDGETRIIEPGAPSNERRLKAFTKLRELGFKVSLRGQPQQESA